MNKQTKIKKIAIACQGGGSHTAFTAGVLKRILKEEKKKFEIVALSGTSGGAICALFAWYGLLKNDKKKSIEMIEQFWYENSAHTYWEKIFNDCILWYSRMPEIFAISSISPYSYPPWAQEYLKKLIENQVDFNELKDLIKSSSPKLFIGAVNVQTGEFRVFKSDTANNEIQVKAILASAAIPTFFRSVEISDKIYWDGLFSQNPPLKDLVKGQNGTKPEEIWIVQINPAFRESEPRSLKEIEDRRNELSGNLSLNQEIDFINSVNKWIDEKTFTDEKYKHVDIEKIEMKWEDLDLASKLDRDDKFIENMMAYGEAQAEDFLYRWKP